MLSPLQRYILRKAFKEGRVTLHDCRQFYQASKQKPTPHDQVNSVTRSVERLIERKYLVGRGRKTAEKWFFDDVQLTPYGKIKVRSLLFQQHLPLMNHTYGHRTKSKKTA